MNARQVTPQTIAPRTLRLLRWLGWALLLATLLLGFAVPAPGYFGVDGWPGFAAVFGLLACAVMVLVAKLLGLLLKRAEDYYSQQAQIRSGADDA
jgi:hypothetical protein